jgi:CubicO group peptidase (beta-lactamase class C family)
MKAVTITSNAALLGLQLQSPDSDCKLGRFATDGVYSRVYKSEFTMCKYSAYYSSFTILLTGGLWLLPDPLIGLVGSADVRATVYAETQEASRLATSAPERVGLDAHRLSLMDPLIAGGIEAGNMPGCVVCVGRHGRIGWLKAYGNKQLQPETQPMTIDTLFDMASITKPVATATSIMKLVENGQLRLSQKVTDVFPEFGTNGKEAITILDLLTHQSGLIPDNALSDYQQGAAIAWQKICELELTAPVGGQFKYSDVNFIVLGKIVEELSGMSLSDYTRQELFGPLGMLETGFVPDEELRRRAAPTEQRDDRWIQGVVHDPRSYELGGVAGHAGLFSTAEDLALYAQMMLGDGTLPALGDQGARRILSAASVRVMTSAYPVSAGLRGLGWDKQSTYSSNRGDLLSPQAFGHGGFTGTVLWIDPELDLFFIFLSNRVHPDGKGHVNSLAGQIANLVSAAVITD